MVIKKPNTDKEYESKELPEGPSLGAEAKQSETRPTTPAEAREQGWTATGMMKMSDPPMIGFEKDGKVIYVREPMRESQKKSFKRPNNKNKKGGSVSKYSKGGGVRPAKYKI